MSIEVNPETVILQALEYSHQSPEPTFKPLNI